MPTVNPLNGTITIDGNVYTIADEGTLATCVLLSKLIDQLEGLRIK